MLLKTGFILLFISLLFDLSFAQSNGDFQRAEFQLIDDFQNHRINKSEAIKRVKQLLEQHTEHKNPIKCFTPLLSGLELEDDFLFKQRNVALAKSANQTPNIAEIFTSPSGRFRLDFFRTGADSVYSTDVADSIGIPDYIERAAAELDSIWLYQVQKLGYRDPLEGVNPYPIRFRNIGSGIYGYTIASGKSITIHSTFKNFPPNTDPEGHVIGALKATLAHEFKHAIQYRYNNFSGNSHAWAEMDATLMEEVNYDEVNDYYNYLWNTGSLFRNPETSVISGSYEDITFALYFHEKYGEDFWPSVWERIVTENSSLLSSLQLELESRGTNLTEAYAEIILWHFFSGSKAIDGFGFKEAAFYPKVNTLAALNGNLTQLKSNSTISNFAYVVLPIVRSNAQGFINTGAILTGAAQRINVVTKLNPAFASIYHTAGNNFHFIKTDETWNSVDTLFFLIPNAQILGVPLSYQVFNQTDQNPGFLTWGDVDFSGTFNQIDVHETLSSLVNFNIVNAVPTYLGDVSANGTLSGFDAAKMLERLNGKTPFFEIDSDQNGKAPETSSFRLPLAKQAQTADSDSILLSFKPLNASQEDARIELVLDYEHDAFAQSVRFSLPFDTLNLDLIEISVDGFISGSELAYAQIGNRAEVVLIADEPLPHGPILTFRFNRKTSITSASFQLDAVQINEITGLNYKSSPLTTEIPTTLGVHKESEFSKIDVFELYTAFPNPFNPETTIRFSNSKNQAIQLDLINSLGQIVRTLKQEFMLSGEHTVRLQAHDLASGVYLVRLRSQSGEQRISKITLIK